MSTIYLSLVIKIYYLVCAHFYLFNECSISTSLLGVQNGKKMLYVSNNLVIGMVVL